MHGIERFGARMYWLTPPTVLLGKPRIQVKLHTQPRQLPEQNRVAVCILTAVAPARTLHLQSSAFSTVHASVVMVLFLHWLHHACCTKHEHLVIDHLLHTC